MVDRVPEPVTQLDDVSWLTHSEAVERFETAWQTQGDAVIADVLPEPSQPHRHLTLLALVEIDQEYRWRAGQRPMVESYLHDWPELGDSDETVAELLAAECLTRAAFDQPVPQPELQQRFPQIAGRIDLAEIERQVHWETVSTGPDAVGTSDGLSHNVIDLTVEITCQTFIERLTESQLMTADQVEQCLLGLPERERPADGRDLAQQLVQMGMLTAYQAGALCRDHGKSLVLGNYVLLDQLGHGGMGHVFKAVHRRMDRIVALKILAPELARTPETLRRFQTEAKAVARLSHPNVVTAHDADEANGRPFLVMEYVDGFDLATLVEQRGPLSAGHALDCVLQAARGLQYAHEHGVVHRDIKPANLILSLVTGHSSLVTGHWSAAGDHGQGTNDKGPQAIVKILDMGLAHLDAGDAAQDEVTGAGQLMGTVDYMAPEQAIDARGADARADIYSLGATLWYLLTGQSMYANRTTSEKLLSHRAGAITSLCSVCPEVPPALDAVFQRMVAKLPEERYQTMAELIADLEASREGSRSGETQGVRDGTRILAHLAAAKRPPWWRDWGKLVAAGAVSFLLIWLGVWIVIREKDGKEVGRMRLPDGGSVTQEPATSSTDPGTPASGAGGAGENSTPRPGIPASGIGGEGAWNLPPDAPPPALAPFDAAGAKTHQEAWAKYLGVPVEVQNSIGMTFVLIPPGEFDMGSTEAEVAGMVEKAKATNRLGCLDRVRTEAPKHRVRITRPFWLGRREVTRGQFRRFVEDRKYRTESERDGTGGFGWLAGRWKRDPRFVWNEDLGVEQQDDHPVVNVTWNDVTAFCAWLSEEEGETSHLPSEAQWEYACRAGATTAWYPGDDQETLQKHAWFIANAGGRTHPVGQKMPSPWGLYDMHGNVWEWCQDCFDHSYYAKSPMDDPQGGPGGFLQARRGGSWIDVADDVRASYRDWFNRDVPFELLGFRVVRIVAGNGSSKMACEPASNAREPAPKPQPQPDAAAPTPSPRQLTPEKVAKGTGVWNLPPDAPLPAIAPFAAAAAKSHQETWAKYLGVCVEIENSLGMTLVLIPPGEFDMGSTDAEVAGELKSAKASKTLDLDHIDRLSAEVPQHRVRITQPFWLGRHEVTRGQFRRFVEACGYQTEAERDGKGGYGLVDGQQTQAPRFCWDADLGFEQTDDYPLVNVSWNDATAFCAWLSEQEGQTSQLPTEAQREYACRAGTTTLWYSGDEASVALDEHAWFDVNAGQKTHPVGQKSPNAWGLFDMHGNVWEWCSDWFDAKYYSKSPLNDPTGPSEGLGRVFRGGGWASEACECRTSYRFCLPSFARNCTRGFRIVRQVNRPDPR